MAGGSAARQEQEKDTETKDTRVATFGGGCFWCVEAVFERYDGVLEAVSGYMGGDVPDPTYEQVCTGRTGHAEVVQVRYDPQRIAYDELLRIFFELHDPTQVDRQGADRGPQYRSVVFWHDEEQKKAAEAAKRELDGSGRYEDPVATEIAEAGPFYRAEAYHQDFFRKNADQPYCRYVITPKLDKLGLER